MKKEIKYNDWDREDRFHPGNYKTILKNKDLNQKYRTPVYKYEESLEETSSEYDEQ